MRLKAFIADRVISGGITHTEKALLVEDGKVKALCNFADIPTDAERVELSGLTLAAGLVDIQVNGGGGVLFNDDCSLNGVKAIAAAHRAAGTTTILPTLISDTPEKTALALAVARECRTQKITGIAGLHLEGPFLNPARSGIHEKNIIEKADTNFLAQQDFSNLGVCFITLAPEMFTKGAIQKLVRAGVVIAAGHSAVNKEQMSLAIAEGLSGITHLFNAMGGMSARETGLSGIALTDDRLACSIIADGAHVAPDMLRLADKAKPKGKLFLVSDAMPPAGQNPPQAFTLQGKHIRAENGKCVDDAGHLAGSAFTLFECVRYAVQHAGFSLEHALAMASLYPAQFLKCDDKIGSLSDGLQADFIAFDADLKLHKVFVSGEAV